MQVVLYMLIIFSFRSAIIVVKRRHPFVHQLYRNFIRYYGAMIYQQHSLSKTCCFILPFAFFFFFLFQAFDLKTKHHSLLSFLKFKDKNKIFSYDSFFYFLFLYLIWEGERNFEEVKMLERNISNEFEGFFFFRGSRIKLKIKFRNAREGKSIRL